MKSYQRLFLFGLAALAFTALISPWAAVAWEQFITGRPDWEVYRYPFSRIFDRFFMISGIILFFVFRPLLRIGSWSEVGLSPRGHAVRDVSIGVVLALASMVALGLAMTLTDIFSPFFRLSLSESLARCAKAVLAAIGAGLAEEFFFRGMIFKGLLEDTSRLRAYFLACLFFAAIHFVKPADDAVLTTVDPWAGFRHLIYSFQPFLDPGALLPGLFGLFLIGAVLCYAFERTGTLYLSIGLHAGWIFSLKTIRVFGDYKRQDLGWMFGSTDPKIVSGIITWLGIVAVGVAIYKITQRRSGLCVKHATSVPLPRFSKKSLSRAAHSEEGRQS
jgi:membrane protease YdiL (CAAX protease family)